MKTNKFFLMAIVGLIAAAMISFAGCSKDEYKSDEETIATPPYAASSTTWTFGSSPLVWSDAIQMPECNKEDFDGGTYDSPKADGRSYTRSGETYYFYSWTFVQANEAKMCPSPWRVPSHNDYLKLWEATYEYAKKDTVWGWPYDVIYVDGHAPGAVTYWLTDTDTDDEDWPYTHYTMWWQSAYGMRDGSRLDNHLSMVRCVK